MNKSYNLLPLLILVMLTSGFILYQQFKINGTVSDGENSIPFAKVKVKATNNSTTADYYGKFSLENMEGQDSVVIAAWAEGFYNGDTKVLPGDSNVQITLHKLFEEDNEDYEFISPFSDDGHELNCQNCHVDILMNQWENNAHGQSAKNPFFHAMYYGTNFKGDSTSGVSFKSDFPTSFGNCASCHIPGAAANNPWGVDPKSVQDANSNGIFCDVCHKIKDVIPTSGQGTTGTLSIEFLRPPEGKQVFFGPYIDVHEPDAYSPIISKSEFCMPCHNAKFWNVPAYQTFNEWKASVYPEMGMQCQTCHMPPDSITTNFVHLNKGGIIRDPLTIPSHSQPGSRDTAILKNAVTMSLSNMVKGDSITVQVVITNDKTGHHVPAGRPSRNMILLVEAIDEYDNKLEFLEGEMIPFWGGSGPVEEGNYSGLPGKGFVKLLEDFEGNIPSPVWRPSHIVSDNRIAAMESDTSNYTFHLPQNFQKVNVNAKLIYRRFYKQWMEEKEFEIPDIIMEEEKMSVPNTSTSVMNVENKKIDIGDGFPNPFTSYINFDISSATESEITVDVFNQSGSQVFSQKIELNPGNKRIQIDLNDQNQGMYYCTFSKENKQLATQKIVKHE